MLRMKAIQKQESFEEQELEGRIRVGRINSFLLRYGARKGLECQFVTSQFQFVEILDNSRIRYMLVDV